MGPGLAGWQWALRQGNLVAGLEEGDAVQAEPVGVSGMVWSTVGRRLGEKSVYARAAATPVCEPTYQEPPGWR